MGTRINICGVAVSLALLPSIAAAELLYGLTPLHQLATFDSAAPGTALTTSAITGLAAGETLLGLDLRPANDGLYTFSSAGNLYLLQSAGGTYAANLVGSTGPFANFPTSGNGLDFNPVVDRLRYVNDAGLNLRLDPLTGGIVSEDTPIVGLSLRGAAYANNVAGAATTTLYAIDATGKQLMVSTNPNGGLYAPVGLLNIIFPPSPVIAFDISGVTGVAYMSFDQTLYTVNLATGAASAVGQIGAGPLVGLAAAGVRGTGPVPEPSTWALLIGGLGLSGAVLRRCRGRHAATA